MSINTPNILSFLLHSFSFFLHITKIKEKKNKKMEFFKKSSSLWDTFAISLVSFIVVFPNINGVFGSHKVYIDLQSSSAVNVKNVHRTGFHFQPPKHWINGTFIFFLSPPNYLLCWFIITIRLKHQFESKV